jgi:hypothetical protein
MSGDAPQRERTQPSEPTDADRAARARRFLELKLYGVSPDTIAEREGLSRAIVYRMIGEAAREADARAAAVTAAAVPGAGPVAMPKKLGEAALLRRAWYTMHLHGGLAASGAVAQLFWLKAVMAIRAEGDGVALLFDEAGYLDAADFAACFGGTPDAFALLTRRRVLLDLDGAGIALPPRLGLLPRERLGGGLVPSRSTIAPDRRQSEMLHIVPGGRSDTGTESTGRVHSVDSESTKPADFGRFESTQSHDSVDSLGLVRTAAAAAKASESTTSSSSSSQQGRERESTKTAASVDSESTGMPNAVDSALSEMLAEVRALAGISTSTNAGSDLGTVERWMMHHSPDAIRALVAEKTKAAGKAVRSLKYFDPAFDETLEARTRPARACDPKAAPPARAPAPALSAADQALLDRLKAPAAAWHKDLHGCPSPPSMAAFKDVATAVEAERWLTVWEAWNERGRPHGLKPPSFANRGVQRAEYDADMAEIEEELTGPDPPGTG